ncbi:hypothetical protein VTI28DRAFT_8642 [Corynascus sepedonium]
MHRFSYLSLALAGLPTILSEYSARAFSQNWNLAREQELERVGSVDRYAAPEPKCDKWSGVEVIYMVEITEVCSDGSTGKI